MTSEDNNTAAHSSSSSVNTVTVLVSAFIFLLLVAAVVSLVRNMERNTASSTVLNASRATSSVMLSETIFVAIWEPLIDTNALARNVAALYNSAECAERVCVGISHNIYNELLRVAQSENKHFILTNTRMMPKAAFEAQSMYAAYPSAERRDVFAELNRGEMYTLFLNSNVRLPANWDTSLTEQLWRCRRNGSIGGAASDEARPVISSEPSDNPSDVLPRFLCAKSVPAAGAAAAAVHYYTTPSFSKDKSRKKSKRDRRGGGAGVVLFSRQMKRNVLKSKPVVQMFCDMQFCFTYTTAWREVVPLCCSVDILASGSASGSGRASDYERYDNLITSWRLWSAGWDFYVPEISPIRIVVRKLTTAATAAEQMHSQISPPIFRPAKMLEAVKYSQINRRDPVYFLVQQAACSGDDGMPTAYTATGVIDSGNSNEVISKYASNEQYLIVIREAAAS